jgi:hypothetical protein
VVRKGSTRPASSVRAGGGYCPHYCVSWTNTEKVRINRLRATDTASFQSDARQGARTSNDMIGRPRMLHADQRVNFLCPQRQRAKLIYSSFFLYERIVGVRSPLHKNQIGLPAGSSHDPPCRRMKCSHRRAASWSDQERSTRMMQRVRL